jgi:hypothetical protein
LAVLQVGLRSPQNIIGRLVHTHSRSVVSLRPIIARCPHLKKPIAPLAL